MGTLPKGRVGVSVPDPPQEEEIRRYLGRLLAAPAFASSARRSKLLAYLCEQALNGQGGRITEYALAFDVFEKPPSFDPRLESTVRAELTRVRQKLKEHYEGEGRTDPIVVELPLRSYVPTFTFRSEAKRPSSARQPFLQLPSKRFTIAAALAACAALAAIGIWALQRRVPDPPPLSLAILPVVVEPSASELRGTEEQITELLNDSVVLRASRASLIGGHFTAGFVGRAGWREARARLPAALFLETTIGRQGDGLHAAMTIRRRSDGGEAWSGVFPVRLDGGRPTLRVVDALVEASVQPVLERQDIYLDCLRTKGIPDVAPPVAGLRDPGNPCSNSAGTGARPTAPDGELLVFEYAHAARSGDARIPFQVGPIFYPAQPPQTRFAVKTGVPLALHAPELFQLSEDTCVLTSFTGTAPVYQRSCIVPGRGSSELALRYVCAPKSYPIDISRFMNDGNLWDADLAPAGTRLFDGVPFVLPEGRNRYWRGSIAAEGGARPVSVTVPVNRTVSTAYFLLNTEWGQAGPESYLALVFRGEGGAEFERKLVGGVDVRDYHNGTLVNTINGTSTRPVFNYGHG